MVKHIVLWKLKDANRRESALKVKELLEGLRGKIPGVITIEVGLDFGGTESSADVALYAEFESKAALDNYQTHPEHEKVKAFIKLVTAERRLADYER